jgi:hypothetical protein
MGLLFSDVPDSEVISNEDLYHSDNYRLSQQELMRILQGLVKKHPECVEGLHNPKDRERCGTIFTQWNNKDMTGSARRCYELTLVNLRSIRRHRDSHPL